MPITWVSRPRSRGHHLIMISSMTKSAPVTFIILFFILRSERTQDRVNKVHPSSRGFLVRRRVQLSSATHLLFTSPDPLNLSFLPIFNSFYRSGYSPSSLRSLHLMIRMRKPSLHFACSLITLTGERVGGIKRSHLMISLLLLSWLRETSVLTTHDRSMSMRIREEKEKEVQHLFSRPSKTELSPRSLLTLRLFMNQKENI